MSRKRLGALDRDQVQAMKVGAEKSAAERREAAFLKAPPIGKVAGAAAQSLEEELLKLRRENAGLREEGDSLSAAREDGRLIECLALDRIDAHALTRDRRTLDRNSEGWAELKSSIRARGQQVPIEVGPAGPDGRYPLISGFRRLNVLRELFEETEASEFSEIRALVVGGRETLGDMLAMVEENEIRQDVSFYERGRLCCLAAEQGLCDDVDLAIEALYPAASRNRRYKIRNFTVIHIQLGAYLDYPEAIGERLGARLAQALKDGRGDELRRVLSERETKFSDAVEELALLEAFVARKGAFGVAVPKAEAVSAGWSGDGYALKARAAKGRVTITLDGIAVEDAEALEELLARIGTTLFD